MADNYCRDPDDLHGDTIVAYIKVAIRRNGSMSTEGAINDLPFALAMLDQAKDAVRSHHMRINQGKKLITPAYDSPQPTTPELIAAIR